MVHVDLIDGLAGRNAAVDYISKKHARGWDHLYKARTCTICEDLRAAGCSAFFRA